MEMDGLGSAPMANAWILTLLLWIGKKFTHDPTL